MRKRNNDRPILSKLEVVGHNIVRVLLDLIVVVSILDTAEVPSDDIGTSAGDDCLFFFVLASVESSWCK